MKKALFLDRDGVINIEKNYVYKIEDFEFMDGIFNLAIDAVEKGYLIIVITNQAGIGRGYYSEEEYLRLTQWMMVQFENKGVEVSRVYHCPYHAEAGIGEYKKDSYDRKPQPGMLYRAKDELDIDLTQSVLVGDKMSDIEAGLNAGLTKLFLFKATDSSTLLEADYRQVSLLSDVAASL